MTQHIDKETTLRVLLTGASGFVGSHVLRHLLVNTDWELVCPVTFRHKGLPARLASAVCDQEWQDRVRIVHWDLRAPADILTRREAGEIDVIMNVASESHVDRSIAQPEQFISNNVQLMLRLLEFARTAHPRLFLQMSTDEVYGPAPLHYEHREWDTVLPSNPYSASKAAQEAIAISYWRTYGLPLVLTNTMNIVGEMQDPEKFLPMIIRSLQAGRPVTVHTSPEGTPGSRFYLHARNLADAWLWLTRYFLDEIHVGTYAQPDLKLSRGVPAYPAHGRPSRFHIVGEREVDNIQMVGAVGRILGMDEDRVASLVQPVSFHESRPGHDLRYALDGSKIARAGWRAPVPFDEALDRTVKWTLEHPEWLAL